MRFRVAPAADRVAVPLDTLLALYNRPSGETHLLAQPLPEIVAALDAGEAGLSAIAERLGLAATGQTLAVLADRLAELEASGLVSRA